MKHYIYTIMMLLAMAGSAYAQRDIPAAIVHLKNGTADTVLLDHSFMGARTYGLSNPQEGDYVKLLSYGEYSSYSSSSLFERENGISVNWQKTVDCPIGNYGLVVSNKEITDELLSKYSYMFNGSLGSAYLLQVPESENEKTTVKIYESNHMSDGAAVNFKSKIPYPNDGKMYYIRAYYDSKPYQFSQQWEAKSALAYEKILEEYGANYIFQNYNIVAISYDINALKAKYSSVLGSLSDKYIDDAVKLLLRHSDKYYEEFYNNKTANGRCVYYGSVYPYIYCSAIPEVVEKVIVDAIGEANSKLTLKEEIEKAGAAKEFVEYLGTLETMLIDKEAYDKDGTMKLIKGNSYSNKARLDSNATLFIPNDNAWNNAMADARRYYNYAANMSYNDLTGNTTAAASFNLSEGRKSLPSIDAEEYSNNARYEALTRNLAFSETDSENKALLTGNAADSKTLLSTRGAVVTNTAEVLSHSGTAQAASFGHTRLLDSYAFNPTETYNPTLEYATPSRALMLRDNKVTNYSVKKSDLSEDVLSELPDFIKQRLFDEEGVMQYAVTENLSSNVAKPELDYSLKDVRSGKYRIYVVVMPAQIQDPEATLKPLYLRFDMLYAKEDGGTTMARINVEGAKITADIIVPEDGKAHAVELPFTFPVCYYGLEAYPTLLISHAKAFATSSNRNKYEQILRIAKIIAVPVQE